MISNHIMQQFYELLLCIIYMDTIELSNSQIDIDELFPEFPVLFGQGQSHAFSTLPNMRFLLKLTEKLSENLGVPLGKNTPCQVANV